MRSRASRKAKCTYPRREWINGDYLRSTRMVHIVRSHYKKKSSCRRMGFQMPRRIFQPVQMLNHHQRHTMDGSYPSRAVTLVSTRDTICRMIRHGDLYGWRLFDPDIRTSVSKFFFLVVSPFKKWFGMDLFFRTEHHGHGHRWRIHRQHITLFYRFKIEQHLGATGAAEEDRGNDVGLNFCRALEGALWQIFCVVELSYQFYLQVLEPPTHS